MPRNDFFSETYKIKCRAIWWENGCLSAREVLRLKILLPDEFGKTVGEGTLNHWIHDDWVEWRDVMNAELSAQVENEIMRERVEIIKEQLTQSRTIRNKAHEYLKEGKFDTSAAAVSAFFKASAEERGLMQIQKVIMTLEKKETPDLVQEFRELAERAGATEIEEQEEVAEPLD